MDRRDTTEIARTLIRRFGAAAPAQIRRRRDSHLRCAEADGAAFWAAVLSEADAILYGHRPEEPMGKPRLTC